MKLYLIQHAEAFSAEVDPVRALTPAGICAALKMREWVARLAPSVPALWHSGKLRALQTAEFLEPFVGPAGIVEAHAGLNPKDEIMPIAKEINRRTADVAVVGHLPHLAKLASYLLTGHEDPSIVAFTFAGIVCLERDESNRWRLCWMVTPDNLGA